MTLSRPERKLLSWLAAQARPVILEALMEAPYYNARRLDQLLKKRLIYTPNPGFLGTEPRTYAITDEGRAALESDKLLLASDRRSWIALFVSIIALAFSIASYFD